MTGVGGEAPILPELRRAIDTAREEVVVAEDGPYRELMATYVALGEALTSGRVDPDLEVDCGDLVTRLLKLGAWMERLSDQRWALWMAEVMREQ